MKSGFIPLIVACLVTVGVLSFYGTPLTALIKYALYFVFAVGLPGTLVWRLLRGPTSSLPADIAAGAALGLALELGSYLLFSALSLQRYVWVWPVTVVAASLIFPRFRKSWQVRFERQPLILSWGLGAGASIAAILLAGSFRSNQIVAGPNGAFPIAPYTDMPFHQALGASALHTFPPVIPYVIDEPLRYQFFVYEHFAAAHWISSVDLTWIVYRLYPIALIAITIVLVSYLVYCLTNKSAKSAAFAAIWVASSDMIMLGVSGTAPTFAFHMLSPTQNYGAALFAAIPLLLYTLFKSKPEQSKKKTASLWVAFSILTFASMGGKATFVPLLVSGLLLVFFAQLVCIRSLNKVALRALVISLVALAIEYFVILRGNASGLNVDPFGTVRMFLVGAGGEGIDQGVLLTLVYGFATVFCVAGTALAAFVKFSDRNIRWDSTYLLLLGISIAGVLICLGTYQGGGSQAYFLASAWPYIGVLAIWGIWKWHNEGAVPSTAIAAPVIIGCIAFVIAIRMSLGKDISWRVILACALFIALLALVALVFLPKRRSKVATLAVIASSLLLGASMGSGVHAIGEFTAAAIREDQRYSATNQKLSPKASRLATWLKNNSETNDLVATNAHCKNDVDPLSGECIGTNFWISALAQRQMLVEGWSYTQSAVKLGSAEGKIGESKNFWNKPMLVENDEAIYNPTQESLDEFTNKYGIRWIFVDRTVREESPRLKQYAELVKENSDAAIYRIN